MAEASGAAAEESTGPSLLQAITTSTGLHRFGLYIEQHAPQLRPLLYFCVDVERLRLQSEEELKLGVCCTSPSQHLAYNRIIKFERRNVRQLSRHRAVYTPCHRPARHLKSTPFPLPICSEPCPGGGQLISSSHHQSGLLVLLAVSSSSSAVN